VDPSWLEFSVEVVTPEFPRLVDGVPLVTPPLGGGSRDDPRALVDDENPEPPRLVDGVPLVTPPLVGGADDEPGVLVEDGGQDALVDPLAAPLLERSPLEDARDVEEFVELGLPDPPLPTWQRPSTQWRPAPHSESVLHRRTHVLPSRTSSSPHSTQPAGNDSRPTRAVSAARWTIRHSGAQGMVPLYPNQTPARRTTRHGMPAGGPSPASSVMSITLEAHVSG
jgi:hypothetical protein